MNEITFDFDHLSMEDIQGMIDAYSGRYCIADEMTAISAAKPTSPTLPPVDWSDRYGWCSLTLEQIMAVRTEFWQRVVDELRKRLLSRLG